MIRVTGDRLKEFIKLKNEILDEVGGVLGDGPPRFRDGEKVNHRLGTGTIISTSINSMGKFVYRVSFGRRLSHKDVSDEFRWARNMDGTRPFAYPPSLGEIDLISGMTKRDVVSQLGDIVSDE